MERDERGWEKADANQEPTLTSYTSVLAWTGASKCEDGEGYTSVALFSKALSGIW